MERGARKREKIVPLHGGFAGSGEVYRTWMHEPFLERLADQRYQERAACTLGAFLVMRLVDRYAVEAGYTDPDALAYQESSALEYVLKLDPENAETGHLVELIRVSNQVRMRGSRKLLWAPLLAYAYWLEQELRLKEALDVVETALRMNDGTAPEKEVAALLQQARIQRLMGYFDLARESYKGARERAELLGDTHGVLLARIGDAIVLRQKGNLPASERVLVKVLNDAERLGDQDAQARAHHDLGVLAANRLAYEESLDHLFKAFDMYVDTESKLRALSDAGEVLKRLGEFSVARDAFTAVVNRSQAADTRAVAEIALMELSALSGHRLEFLRRKTVLQDGVDSLPPERRTDFYLQAGLGYARFGQVRLARKHLDTALELAESLSLTEYIFRAETALAWLTRNPKEVDSAPDEAAESVRSHRVKLTNIAAKLEAVRCAYENAGTTS